MIDKTLKYRVTTQYAIDAEGKLWAYKIVPTGGGEYVARSTNRFITQAAAKAAGLEMMAELGLSRDMRGTGSKSSVGRKPAAEKMQQTTVYAPQSLLEFAATVGINKSKLFVDALAEKKAAYDTSLRLFYCCFIAVYRVNSRDLADTAGSASRESITAGLSSR